MTVDELIKKYAHSPEEFPILAEQTHKIIRDGKRVTEKININENIVHYVMDTALLVSKIDGRLDGYAYDHVVYLDKSARPVSWLVNLFWDEFAQRDNAEKPVKRPRHSYINIDRSPWFRNVGLEVSDDGRQKSNGELAKYSDFVNNIGNLDKKHLAEIRALYVEGGINTEDSEQIMKTPTFLDGKRVLIVDEVSRTGATLDIAKHLFRLAFPDAGAIEGSYFWHPSEPMLMMGDESVLTSLPVWYDPNSLTGRGIGSPDAHFYRNLFNSYVEKYKNENRFQINKFRTYAFSSPVYSAPLLTDTGEILGLKAEKKTRMLCQDLHKLYAEYKSGHLFFTPPIEWMDFEGFDELIEKQGVKVIPLDASNQEANQIRMSPLFYLNFITKLKNYTK